MASRIPPLLEPYVRLPPENSLILLTGVLGAGTNWLVQRCLYSYLALPAKVVGEQQNEVATTEQTAVVLVSFLRDYAFWRDGVGRLGVDLDALAKKGRFVFVDGLTELFRASSGPESKSAASGNAEKKLLSNSTLEHLSRQLSEAITKSQARGLKSKVVLILDNPDLILAASGNHTSGSALQELLLELREKVHASVVTLSADEPLVSLQTTTLEKDHAAFTLSLAHESELVISLRRLDTGTAKDVSGVLRVTNGGGLVVGPGVEERELLYFVGGDSGVRVFERG